MSDVEIKDIKGIHEKCLDFLLEYQLKKTNFFFVPRKINNKNRLANGMYFRGNDNYLVLSFWDSSDSKEQIYNISFSVNLGGKPSIELSYRDDDTKISHIIEIKKIIEKRHKPYKSKKVNRWSYFYSDGMDYIDALKDFILYEKPEIDKYIKSHPDCTLVREFLHISNYLNYAVKFFYIFSILRSAIFVPFLRPYVFHSTLAL